MNEVAQNRARSTIRLAVLISGGGTTLKNLIEKIAESQLDAEIAIVVSSNPDAGGLNHAKAANIPSKVFAKAKTTAAEEYRDAVFGACREANVDLVVMGGFLKHILIPDDFENRVINIHPSLIPDFCGKGFYGQRVHKAVLEAGATKSGCTVHFVDDEYDHGPVILQREVDVLPDDTPQSLAARVFEAECDALPAAIRQVAADRNQIQNR